jgi:hypothetical protein
MHDVNILLSDCSRGGRTGMGCPGKTVESEAAPGPKRRRRLRGEMTPWRDSLRGSVGAVRDNIHYPHVRRGFRASRWRRETPTPTRSPRWDQTHAIRNAGRYPVPHPSLILVAAAPFQTGQCPGWCAAAGCLALAVDYAARS